MNHSTLLQTTRIQQSSYIVFPPEGPRPPNGSRKQVLEGLKELKPNAETMALVDEIMAEKELKKKRYEENRTKMINSQDAAAADTGPKQTWTQWIMGYPASK
jgi:hypothetical protein